MAVVDQRWSGVGDTSHAAQQDPLRPAPLRYVTTTADGTDLVELALITGGYVCEATYAGSYQTPGAGRGRPESARNLGAPADGPEPAVSLHSPGCGYRRE